MENIGLGKFVVFAIFTYCVLHSGVYLLVATITVLVGK